MRTTLSLDGLPTFAHSPLFCTLDDDVDTGLSRFEDTYSRARVALRFLQKHGAPADILHVRPEELDAMHAGYLRAALMEYVGMEDSLPRDLRRLGLPGPALRISDTGNAMLILLRELRHVHVHVGRAQVIRRERQAILRAPDREIETTLDVLTVPRADLDQLMDARHAKRFRTAELKAAIDWLDLAQSQWGVRDVVQSAISEWGRRILLTHGAG